MQIKIEIDVKPDELRRFLGLPDVAGLQDDVVRFLRDKVEAAGESFDPAAVVQGSVELIKRTPAWRMLRTAMLGKDAINAEAALAAAEPVPKQPARRKPAASTAAKRPRKAAARKRAAKPAPEPTPE